ncbi:MAG: thioredoxin [Candidatus Schekmanbacteria bacterium]|nr:thioredoxin [Candidatus Schekmanbacteria bacterium]
MGNATMQLTEATFDSEVYGSRFPVLVSFCADWCAPCRMLSPIVDELATEYSGRVKIAVIDVDENSAVAHRLGIRCVPALVLFAKGEVVEQLVGVRTKKELIALLDRLA